MKHIFLLDRSSLESRLAKQNMQELLSSAAAELGRQNLAAFRQEAGHSPGASTSASTPSGSTHQAGNFRKKCRIFPEICRGNFRAISGNLPGNFQKFSRKCPGSFLDISGFFPGHVQEMSGKCRGNVREMFRTFPGNFQGISRNLQEMSRNISGNFRENSGNVLRKS